MYRLASRFMRTLFATFLALSASLAMAQQTFSKEQIDQMMAPIALYPDSLLSQVLMAATYPADVADAAKWSKANPKQSGDAAVKAVQDQTWDPSVQSLVAFPQVIQMMGDQPDWVQNLGDAFLASSKDVLDSAQRLRAKAQQTGNLKTTEQQTVTVEQEPQTQQTVIKIEPTNPQTVYELWTADRDRTGAGSLVLEVGSNTLTFTMPALSLVEQTDPVADGGKRAEVMLPMTFKAYGNSAHNDELTVTHD